MPTQAWHIDHDWAGPLAPPRGLEVHANFGDVEPRAGGMTIVAGSHRLVHRRFTEHPPPPGAKASPLRRELLRGHPYLADLQTEGEPAARSARFNERVEIVDGIPLQAVENTARAGDVILMHPLLLHTRPVNAGTEPRFVLNKDLYL